MKAFFIALSLLGTLLLTAQASAGQVICTTKGSLTDVTLTIASTSLTNGDHAILITAKGVLESTYELTPISTEQSRTQLSVKAFSDIGYFIRQIPTFEAHPPPRPKIRRVVEALLEIETVDSGSDQIFTNVASGKGKLTLTGDLTGAYPRLDPQYELENCQGELN